MTVSTQDGPKWILTLLGHYYKNKWHIKNLYMKKVVCIMSSPPQETGCSFWGTRRWWSHFQAEVSKWAWERERRHMRLHRLHVCLYAYTIRIYTAQYAGSCLCYVLFIHLLGSFTATVFLINWKKTRELGRCTFPAGPLSVTITPWLALQDAVSPGNKSPFLKRAGMEGKK